MCFIFFIMKTFPLIIFVLVISPACSDTSKLKDYAKLFKEVFSRAPKKIPDFVPSSDFLFQNLKDITAYPHKWVFKAINSLCSAALSSDAIDPHVTPNIENMSFVLMTPTDNYSFPLLEASLMWTSPSFELGKKVVILVTGWQTSLDDSGAVAALSEAYFCQGDTNFVVVDTARFIDTLYTWSAFNTEEIGQSIGRGLTELMKLTPLENVHLIGHSLGAHIVGAAGRWFTFLTNKQLPRITGLDPANPCFNEGETLSGLQRGDAEFIDVIHSNSGVLGKRDPLGDIDFYPGGITALPPGCLDMSCAHSRAWKYYAETVRPGNELNFLTIRCSSLYKLKAGKCIGNEIPMGYKVPPTAKGNYVLDVNAKPPFGKNAAFNAK